jgi:hypothetical protein
VIDLPTSGIGGGYRWKKYSLELPTDAYSGEAQLGFQYDDSNDLGYGAAIDNVLIDEVETSGIESTPLQLNVSLFPNPASNQSTLDISGAGAVPVYLKLIGIDGKTHWSKIRQNLPDGQETINLEGLANGVYYIMIEYADQVIVKSLVKQN